jgi:uncharacterized membrane-anchored protein YitT (DUF2179 family)
LAYAALAAVGGRGKLSTMQFGLRWLLVVVTSFAVVAGLARLSVSKALVAGCFGGLAWMLASLAKDALGQEGDFNQAHGIMLAIVCVPTAILALVIAVAIILGIS